MKQTAAENKILIGNAMDLQWKVIDLAQKIQNVSVEMNGIYWDVLIPAWQRFARSMLLVWEFHP